jgi:type III secretory pathway component EscS
MKTTAFIVALIAIVATLGFMYKHYDQKFNQYIVKKVN